jgi:hypothetical protein
MLPILFTALDRRAPVGRDGRYAILRGEIYCCAKFRRTYFF